MPNKFVSKIDLDVQLKSLNRECEISAAAHVVDKLPCPKPGAMPSHSEDPMPSKLKIENSLFSTKINGKEFDELKDKLNEHER